MKRIAIIGSGISAITLGKELAKRAHVTLFEKSKGMGGRMSTRYADPFSFDHGTPFFKIESKEFYTYLKPYIDAGVLSEWQGAKIQLEIGKEVIQPADKEPLWTPTPKMNSLCKAIGESLSIRISCEIAPLTPKTPLGWLLQNQKGEELGYFDWVISTAPPQQSKTLFHNIGEEENFLKSAAMSSCYTLMIGFKKEWDKQWISAAVKKNLINSIFVNSTKPGRDRNVTTFVAHSTTEWAEANINEKIDEIQEKMCTEFTLLTGIDTKNAEYIATHRWLYAKTKTPKKNGFYINGEIGLAAVGDWCAGENIEDGWKEALKLSSNILSFFE